MESQDSFAKTIHPVMRRIPTVRFLWKKSGLGKTRTSITAPIWNAAEDPLHAPLVEYIDKMAAERGMRTIKVLIRDREISNAESDQGSYLNPTEPQFTIDIGMLKEQGYYTQQPPVISRTLHALIEHELYHANNTRRDRLVRYAGGALAAAAVMTAVHMIGAKLGNGAHRVAQWCATIASGLIANDLVYSWLRRQEEFRADAQITDPQAGIEVRELSGAAPQKGGVLEWIDNLQSGHPTSEARTAAHRARLSENHSPKRTAVERARLSERHAPDRTAVERVRNAEQSSVYTGR